MSFPDSQFGGMRILGLITTLMQLGFHGWFGHQVCHNCPCHQGFLLEDLQVSCTVPYHQDCLFTSSSQLCVHVLYSEALWQRAVWSLRLVP